MGAEPIHKRLERLRTSKGFTLKETARAIEVPESTYREWKNGRGLRLPPFQKISQLFAISVTELISGEKPDLIFVTGELEEAEKKLNVLRRKLSSWI